MFTIRFYLFTILVAFAMVAIGHDATAEELANGLTATFTKSSDWGSGYEGKYTIANAGTTAITSWTVEFDLPTGHRVASLWDGSYTASGQHVTVKSTWNGNVGPGGSASFGFNVAYSGGYSAPSGCKINGGACEDGGPTNPPGAPGTPGTPSVTSVTNSSISLAWGASSGTVTGYRVYEGTAVSATVTGTSTTISGLSACATRTYTVAAYNNAGESVKSGAVTGTTSGCTQGPLPKHFLTGYWHNFVNPAVELKLRDVPAEYDVIAIAFAEASATPGTVTFGVDSGLSSALGGYSNADFKADVQTLKSRGKKIILSVGGEAGRVSVSDSASATNFANSVRSIMSEYGFDGVDIDLENGLNPTYMAQALRSLRSQVGSSLIITMAPQTIDMQSTGASYFQLALNIKDILTVVHTQYYNSGSMLGCDQAQAYSQGSINFITALACIQLENGLRPDQVALGLPAGTGAANGGVVAPSVVNNALDCLARGTNCGSFKPPHTYAAIRGAMTWSINWDVSNGNNFARTVRPHLDTLP
ncbi:glycosyl hydrolase family 18 protein [Pendulispora brunnea]|uniref:chitinase n=1 Tax=Pendulispora brunnea TaxID=2905690 RepID=A0ABZ2K7V0_9BACT